VNDILHIIRFSWSLKRYYLWIAVMVVITSLLAQATPFFLRSIVDNLVALQHGSIGWDVFLLPVVLILLVNVAITLISNLSGYYGDKLGVKLESLLSERYYAHILKLPISYFDNEVAGRITSRLERSIVTISQLMSAFANNFVGFFLTSAITLIILAYYAWPVAVLLAILFPLYIWLTTLSSRTWQRHQQGINQNTDQANGRFVESIGQIRLVKSYVQEKLERRYYSDRRRSIEKTTYVQSKGWHWIDIARRLSLNIIFALIYAYIVYETYRGHYTLGDLTLLLTFVTQAQIPLFASSFIVDNLQRAQAGSKDYFEIMNTEPTIVDRSGAETLKVDRGQIDFHQVSFAYGEGQPVLDQINFTVEPGTRVALVGESGQGKTTITNLLMRFYEPTAGQITIDGTNIEEVTQDSLRSQIAVVFQEPALFSGTVRHNIAYAHPDASLDQIEAAAKVANAHDFISKLPNGYDTEIGERGVKLSGGQRQRIAIARAVLKDAPILILDEATSSLDSRAEREVQTALDALMVGRTAIVVAHRLSTIASVDKIVALEQGQIVEEGSPAKLATTGGLYAQLLELQTKPAGKTKLRRYQLRG